MNSPLLSEWASGLFSDDGPNVDPELTQDILHSLNFDNLPPATELLGRLAAATDRRSNWSAPNYPRPITAFLAKNIVALLDEVNPDNHGFLLDIFHAAHIDWDMLEPILLLGRKVARTAVERKARLVGDWPRATG